MEDIKKATIINITKTISNYISEAARVAFPNVTIKPLITPHNSSNSDFSTPAATTIFNKHRNDVGWTLPSSKEVAEEILAQLPPLHMIECIEVTQQSAAGSTKKEKPKKDGETTQNEGETSKKEKKVQAPNFFINFRISDDWITKTAVKIIRQGLTVESEYSTRTVLVDFSSPNIAKEMHVGHMRSTLLGETICRILEFLGADVDRVNHIGDWGTQFGTLIAHLEETYPDYATNIPNMSSLAEFYADSKKKFNENEQFKAKSQERTIQLQNGDEEITKAWKLICRLSIEEFHLVYDKLGVKITEVGESFYNDMGRVLTDSLKSQGKAELDKGALIYRTSKHKQPLMIVKSDGGLTYDTSDLAAINYRLTNLNKDWVIYVIGKEQELHMKLIFSAAEELGWHQPPKTRVDHVGFGMILDKNGKKLASRNGGAPKLKELIDVSKQLAKESLISHQKNKGTEFSDEYLEDASEKLGINSLRYYDLKQNRLSDYKFEETKVLDDRGNTAVYLIYCYVRILSVYANQELTIEKVKELANTEAIEISHEKERKLLLHLLRFADVIDSTLDDLLINKITDYLYETTTLFSEFYHDCIIKGNNSRILITELTRMIVKQCFDFIGIEHIEKI